MHEILNEGETWVALGFVLVLALLWWKGVPGMIAGILDQRAAMISAELDEARKLRVEAAALLEDYKKRAASAEAEAAGIVEAAKADAAQFARDSRTALAAQIERRAAAAKDKIAQAEAAALNEIRALAADAAVSAAQKLIAARMDEKRTGSLIDASIKDLGSKLN
ncbi:MAG: synthase subunit [Alphaproteobacteria bacterium]|jgi:F-type H+-transporting ATPase subunit b|nr:synthase subunit [Alphaproteobacteria bacterium]MDB5740760.1 synthase subunit [Alphaproteobacteria bacterium]